MEKEHLVNYKILQLNRKLLENQYKNTEFYKKFNVKTKGKTVLEFCREV